MEKVIADDEISLDPEHLAGYYGKGWAAFARWSKAMVSYHHAHKAVNPYRESLKSGEADLNGLMAARKSTTDCLD